AEAPLASSEAFFYPTLRSDKLDYAPGETVTLMGEGWRPNEQVAINIRESSGDPDTNLTATADANGAFTNSEFQTNPDRSDVGVRFLATATGLASRWTAQTTFSDTAQFTATINPTSATVNTATTYTLTVTNTSTAMEVMDCVRVTIPAGAGTPGFFFQAEDGIRPRNVTGVQTCALPICRRSPPVTHHSSSRRSSPGSSATVRCSRRGRR